MAKRASARATTGGTPATLVAGLLVLSVALTVVGGQLLASASSPSSTPSDDWSSGHHDPTRGSEGFVVARGKLGEAGGAVPEGTTVFDTAIPGVAKLDPHLLGAVRRAATRAAADGVEFVVDSGWRSRDYQQRLLDQAVAKYGSLEEASRWVATPTTSAHVRGEAIDIGHASAAAWLSRHGAEYGLCQIYANEPWHFELRPAAMDHGCPAMYSDARNDPRMYG